MIGRVLPRAQAAGPPLARLYEPRPEGHEVAPHLIACWEGGMMLAGLQPGPEWRPGVRRLAGILELPVAALGTQAPELPVWHCVASAAPGDPLLGDEAWAAVAAEVMHRTGYCERGREHEGVRWIAIRNSLTRVHVVATLARQDGRRAHSAHEYHRIGEVMRWAEREHGLQPLAPRRRDVPARPTRDEEDKARRLGLAEPPRSTLYRMASGAAEAARSEREFFGLLAAAGAQVRLKHSDDNPGEVVGYALGLPGDVTGDGQQVWFGGKRLAAGLSLPSLRLQWDPPPPEPADGGSGPAGAGEGPPGAARR